MANLIRVIPDVIKMYEEWVCANPQLTADIESSIKWISYFLAGKVSDSNVVSELVYSLSNLWVLLNDKIILNDKNKLNNINTIDNNVSIKTWITVLEYSEVFIEISARQVWGNKAKWIVIFLIQSFKCALRLLLVLKYRENIVLSPPISPVNRKQVKEEIVNNSNNTNSTPNADESFTLKSGRTIRTVNSASTNARSWTLPSSSSSQQKISHDHYEHYLTDSQRFGEVLYIMKPIVHLSSMYFCGQKAWAPWLLSLLTDVSSIQLLNGPERKEGKKVISVWSKRQLAELQRRKIMLVVYLLRSPFYDNYTKERLTKLLINLSNNVPLVGMILRPLSDYLPHWQNTYLYVWSS